MSDKAQAARLRKIRFATRCAAQHLPAHLPPLLALTDPARTPNVLALGELLPQGSGLIYRHFGHAHRLETAYALARIAKLKRLKLLIGNDPHLASKIGADGVHWSENNLESAKYWRRKFNLMTGAAHCRMAIFRAQKSGVDAALFSAVFPSNSPSAGTPVGALKLRAHTRLAALPIYGLGGVNAGNMGKIASYNGIAAIEGVACTVWK